jgi:DNA modification methylase
MTYTKPGEVVLDPFIGSGSTAVACINTGRRFIGFELFPECYDMAVARIRDAQEQARLFPFPEEGSA